MYKVLQKYTKKHKHEQHGSGVGTASEHYSRSRSEGGMNGIGRGGIPPPSAPNGYYSREQHKSTNGGDIHHAGNLFV